MEKVLVSLPEKFEHKIASLEDSKDLTTMSIAELMSSLQAVEQRQNMRKEVFENKGKHVDVALLAAERTKYLKKIFKKSVGNSSGVSE